MSLPFDISTFGSSLNAEICNIFSKISLNQLVSCNELPIHRIISRSSTSQVAVDIIADSVVNFGFPIGPIMFGSIYGYTVYNLQKCLISILF